MVSRNTIGAVVIPILIECIKGEGVTPAEIEQKTGIRLETLDDLDIRIPVEQHIKLWKFACEVTADPALAIHIREAYGNVRIHFVNTLATNSKNALEALKNWQRYMGIVSEMIRIDIVDEGEHVKLIYNIASPQHLNPWMPEHTFSQAFYFGKVLIEEGFTPIAVTFQHACTSDIATYTAFFDAPVLFKQPENTFVCKKADLTKPFVGSNPHLQQILRKQADRELEKLTGDSSVVEQVKQMIMQQLSTGDLDIESVAEALNMSRTTLYRKLKAESSSYNGLLTDIRKEFAKEYMKNGMNISQMAFLLGYSTASNFMIAFNKWFGKTPGSYRHSIIS